MEEQIYICIDNLLSIKSALNTLKESEQSLNNEVIMNLRNAHTQLVETLIQLIKLRNPTQTNDNTVPNTITIGSMVLAPRYYDGILCNDLSIVVQSIIEETSDNEQQSNSIENLTNSKQMNFKVIWLRPLSVHEMISTGIAFSTEQLRTSGVEYYDMQSQFLKNIRVLDTVLSKSPVDSLWYESKVLKINDTDNMIDVEMSKSGKIQTLNFDITNIAPLPRSYLLIQKSKAFSIKTVDYDSENDETLKHYIDRSNTTIGSSSTTTNLKTTTFDDISGFGNWEAHTKRFGSRMLEKMGYKRGNGLGPKNQGIVVPIQGLLKPLPTGLSLDYISEHTRKSIATVNLRNNKNDAKSKSSKDSAQTNPQKSNEGSVFEFLNNVNSKPMENVSAGTFVGKNNYNNKISGTNKISSTKSSNNNSSLNMIVNYRKNSNSANKNLF